MNDTGIMAPFLASSLVNLFKPENKRQYKFLEDYNSIRMNDFLIKTKIPATLYNIMLTFRDSNISFIIDGGLLRTKSSYKLKVIHCNPKFQKLIYEFGKERKYNNKQKGRKSPGDESLINLLKSPAKMASGFSTLFLPENPTELCDTLKLLLQEKQAGNNCNITDEEIVAIADQLLEYKCISKKQHKILLQKRLN